MPMKISIENGNRGVAMKNVLGAQSVGLPTKGRAPGYGRCKGVAWLLVYSQAPFWHISHTTPHLKPQTNINRMTITKNC